MPGEHLTEVRIGIYATPDDAARITEECGAVLRESGVAHELSLTGPERTPAGRDMAISEVYDELPEQWRLQHPAADPGSRHIHEISIGLVTAHPETTPIRDALTRVICPDPEHSSPCPIPWSSSSEEAGKQRYGHLLRR
ncbi:hypothetical protein SAMN02982929_04734 [Saccharopolyspora kobensis]|uniref:Uncharacterized protein n=1 Tax=Saccharopolyspora kobensis TaxID=146035 RepID=A0A1H6DP00_9PSEU|nr:hypothetical protein [Saccharopolyspora kobensis]SEG87022.1 hypothetical protein SAMN02982929_04734 [Saccharopolyspora kobensis]SFE08282.1 hypothetical protein SAMN05216506_108294 [Saccharopolyspora kobensis]